MRLTFCIPWFGPALGGGAETLCREYARRLALAGHDVEILTTCCRDHDADWFTNHHPPGATTEPEGYRVERFPVRKGSAGVFGDLNRRILGGEILNYRGERAFLDNSISSDRLVARAAECGRDRAVIVLPYLFGLTQGVVHALEGRALLWPCLHDEGYARLRLVADLFQRCPGVIFNAPGERLLAESLGLSVRAGEVVGMGVDLPASADTASPVAAPYLLYLGRRSAEKGLPALLDMFARLSNDRPEVELRVAGKGPPLPGGLRRVTDLGFVDEQAKQALLRGAVALVMPSRRESLSIALLEAFAAGTPGLVDGRCAVLRDHVVAGGAGLYYGNAAEFRECAGRLLSDPALRRGMGSNGRRYVAAHYRWQDCLDRLVRFVARVAPHAN